MPSVVIGFLSGGTNILSGNYFSGQGAYHPVGGVQLVADISNSGNLYIGLSGGVTITSGVVQASGFAGAMDGMQMRPGTPYYIPKIAFNVPGGPGVNCSGQPAIYVLPDSACSGRARLYWEVM